MYVNLMKKQYLELSLKYYLPILDQWWLRIRGSNIPKWSAILSMNFTKSFWPFVKKLSRLEYMWVNINSYSDILWEHAILENLSDFFKKGLNPLKIQGKIQSGVCS
jgi:hypothetical protein